MVKRLRAAVLFLFLFLDGLCPGFLVAFAKGGKTAIVYVPPLLSSSLHDNANKDETVWLDLDIFSLISLVRNYDRLSFNENGLPINPNITSSIKCGGSKRGEIRDIRKFGVANGDKGMMDMLNSVFGPTTVYGCDIIRFNYDWRKSSWNVSEGLLGLFDDYESICFVGYSKGCRVASCLLARIWGDAEKLSKIKCCVFVAGPFYGSSKAWYVLENGIVTGSRFLDFFAWLFGVKKMTRELAKNYPSMYELLPDEDYFKIKAPVTSELGREKDYVVVNDFSTMKCFIEDSDWYKKSDKENKVFIDEAKVERKRVFDKVSDYLAKSGRCFYIYGDGVDTAYRLGRSRDGEFVVFATTGGDGTVACFSAHPRGVGNSNLFSVSGVRHEEMIKNGAVLKKVSDVLKKFL